MQPVKTIGAVIGALGSGLLYWSSIDRYGDQGGPAGAGIAVVIEVVYLLVFSAIGAGLGYGVSWVILAAIKYRRGGPKDRE